jgi:hypothetical protein
MSRRRRSGGLVGATRIIPKTWRRANRLPAGRKWRRGGQTSRYQGLLDTPRVTGRGATGPVDPKFRMGHSKNPTSPALSSR